MVEWTTMVKTIIKEIESVIVAVTINKRPSLMMELVEAHSNYTKLQRVTAKCKKNLM